MWNYADSFEQRTLGKEFRWTIPVEEALIDANFLKKNLESRKLLSTTIMMTIIFFPQKKCLKI